ncbi:hypothetical protein CD30_06265 [Ureibacillus massiliensis 4400831 = CIP 108448 = CCUG 49529]|uniref:Uncharacterized protein n=1 Tax=Ureibacillus massiliensis 4400831 = CIP 108448 = CCUG 49529 TaxID=1211035 RepID=A0A0A3J8C1_9BACL|nr:hypothetical protein CD30_06265 [Ureibacillus massiliensis 4400831 = CIP 108448 = CCUG 49529]
MITSDIVYSPFIYSLSFFQIALIVLELAHKSLKTSLNFKDAHLKVRKPQVDLKKTHLNIKFYESYNNEPPEKIKKAVPIKGTTHLLVVPPFFLPIHLIVSDEALGRLTYR